MRSELPNGNVDPTRRVIGSIGGNVFNEGSEEHLASLGQEPERPVRPPNPENTVVVDPRIRLDQELGSANENLARSLKDLEDVAKSPMLATIFPGGGGFESKLANRQASVQEAQWQVYMLKLASETLNTSGGNFEAALKWLGEQEEVMDRSVISANADREAARSLNNADAYAAADAQREQAIRFRGMYSAAALKLESLKDEKK